MVVLMLGKGFNSLYRLDEFIKQSADEKQNLQEEIKMIDRKIDILSFTKKQFHTVKMYRQIFQEYKSDISDKPFFEEHKSKIIQ